MKQRSFTLLEVMIAICLFAIASGWISFKMHGAIEKKKFQSAINRLKSELIVAQKLAIAMQVDWSGVLKKEKNGWVFSVESQDKKLKPLHLGQLNIISEGKNIKEVLYFDFFASGYTNLEGTIVFEKGSTRETVKMGELFSRDTGKN